MSSTQDLDYPRILFQYNNGFLVSKIMFTACELGVFDLLLASEGSLSSDAIAERLGTSVSGMERLLDACVGLKLLEVKMKSEGAFYRNTELSNLYLAKSSLKSQYHRLMYYSKTVYFCWQYLTDAVRDGKNQYERAFGMSSEDIFGALYRSEEEMIQFMYSLNTFWSICGRDEIAAFDLSPFTVIYDLGGEKFCNTSFWKYQSVPYDGIFQNLPNERCFLEGTLLCGNPTTGASEKTVRHMGYWQGCAGGLAQECISLYPKSTVTIYDLPKVVQVAKEHFVPPEEHRITFHEGDFFKDPIPEADLYILARILHDWADDKCMQLLTKIYKACKPGGGVLLVETLLNEDKTGPLEAQLFSLIMLVQAEGKERMPTEYSKLLAAAGFREIQV